jgi:hypothetical protein
MIQHLLPSIWQILDAELWIGGQKCCHGGKPTCVPVSVDEYF